MTPILRPGALLLLLLGAACATQYRSDAHFDRSFDFSKVQHLAIRPADPDMPIATESNRATIDRAIRANLEGKGYTFVPERDAELILIVHAGVHSRVRLSGAVPSSDEGRLIINFVTSDKGDSVWYGWIETTWRGVVAEDVDAVIEEAVDELLAGFPAR